MGEHILARDLMRTDFETITTDQTLGDAMAALRATQREDRRPSALMVVGEDGIFQGMLTARLLIRVLVGKGEVDDSALLHVAQERLQERVGDCLVDGIPVVAPSDRLLTLIRRGAAQRLDFVAVVDEGRPVGFAPITAIFQAVAQMALTPDDEGVRFDR